MKGKKPSRNNGPKEAESEPPEDKNAKQPGKSPVVSPLPNRQPRNLTHPAVSPEGEQSDASKRPTGQVRQRSLGVFFLMPAIRNSSAKEESPQPNSQDNVTPSPSSSPSRKKVGMGPELYPQGRKVGLKKMKSNYDTRYSLAFQLPQTDENAIQRLTAAALQLINILNSAAIMLNEHVVVASWRKRLEFPGPPEKISIAKDWKDPVRIKLLTPGNLYISRGGWVNTKVRIGTFHEPETVVKYLKEALEIVGTTAGRAEICPIQAEEVDTLGWFYMSSEALRPSRLALSVKDELDIEVHCSYRNVFIPRQKELSKETGEQEDKWVQVSAIHIDCRTEDVDKLTIPLK